MTPPLSRRRRDLRRVEEHLDHHRGPPGGGGGDRGPSGRTDRDRLHLRRPGHVAKGLRDFGRANPLLIIKAGVLEGKVMTPDEVRRLADLESREVLLAKVAGGMQGILQQAISLISAPLSQAARLIAALEQAAAENPSLLAAPAPRRSRPTPTWSRPRTPRSRPTPNWRPPRRPPPSPATKSSPLRRHPQHRCNYTLDGDHRRGHLSQHPLRKTSRKGSPNYPGHQHRRAP